MGGVLVLAVILASLAVILAVLSLLAVHVRRRGIGEQVMGPFDEIWHPTANATRIEIRKQQERSAPRTPPADPLRPPDAASHDRRRSRRRED